MGTLSDPAAKIISGLIKEHGIDHPEIKKILSRSYKNIFCKEVWYGETGSGYKSWRRQVRIALGEIPRRKPARRPEGKNEDKQMELFES